MIRQIMNGAVAALMMSAGAVALASTPASAAACQQGEGVSVVLGSNVTCVAHTGGDAAANFGAAGIKLEQVQRQPGMICKVNGLPTDAGCVNSPPANAYWGLFWSDGTSGAWKYSTLGVSGLTVPRGGWVAFVFQNSNSRTPPGIKPMAVAPQVKPTQQPDKPKATREPDAPKVKESKSSGSATRTQPTQSASPAPTQTPTPLSTTSSPGSKKAKATPTPSASPSAGAPLSVDEQAAQAQMVETSQDQNGSDSLGWVAGGAVALLLVAGIGTTAWRRRGDGGHS